MSIQTEDITFAANLRVPQIVQDFLSTLREFGSIAAISDNPKTSVTLHVHASTEDDAVVVGQRLAMALGAKLITPAFPNTPMGGGWAHTPTYRWEFATPTYAGERQWTLMVPITSDLLHLFDTVTGIGSWDRSYLGQSELPVTIYGSDQDDLMSVKADFEHEMYSWFGEPVVFTPAN